MINELLRLTRPLVVFDVETTGLDPQKDRIVELGLQVWYHDGRPLKEYRTLVNPECDIPAETSRVHKITSESIALCATCGGAEAEGNGNFCTCENFKRWPTFKQLAPHLLRGFVGVDFAGKNVRFDLRMMSAEMERAGVAWSYRGARIIDADRLEQIGEPRHLSNLYEKHTGKKLEDAHQALADVRATTEVLEAQLKKYVVLPRDLDQLHRLQWENEWIDGEGKFKMVNGVATCTFGKHKGVPMKDVPRDYYDWILKPTTTMPADVKALAAEAKMGKFPE